MINTSERNVKLMWALVLGNMVMFSAIAAAVVAGYTAQLDNAVLTMFRTPDGVTRGPIWLRESLVELTALGGYPVIVLCTLLVVTSMLIAGRARAAGLLGLCIAGGSIASTLLKQLFDRPRPDMFEHLDIIFTSSFPSAHAMVSMVSWLTLSFFAIRYVRSRALQIYFMLCALMLSLLIGVSRVYLGVHWPTDVLAGWSVGIAWAGMCWLLAHYLAKIPERVGQFGKS